MGNHSFYPFSSKRTIKTKINYIPDYKESKYWENRNVYVFEKALGEDIRIVFEDEKTFIYSDKKIDTQPIIDFFNSNLLAGMGKLIKAFNRVSFAMFATFINKNSSIEYGREDIIINDIFINGNWVCQDDFVELLNKCDMISSPLVYKGIFDINEIIKTIDKNSSISFNKDVPIYSIIIRPSIEDFVNSSDRLVAKIVNSKFEDEQEKKDRILESVVEQFISIKLESAPFIRKCLDELKKESIDLKKENIKLILPKLVDLFFSSFNSDIASLGEFKADRFTIISNLLKKKLPNNFRKAFEI